jgi:anti-sigma factor RsiW
MFAQLSEYLDGELAPEVRREMEEHLCDCQPCVEFLDSLRRTITLCRQYELADSAKPVSPEIRQQLLASFRQMVSARRGELSG